MDTILANYWRKQNWHGTTIFLDNRLTILRFTPQVKKLFKVIATDVGRTITDIAFKFDYDDLERSIHNVIESLIAQEAEIKTRDGDWYNLRIMPYRTLDNFISGAVLTFSKITKFKVVEKQLTQQAGINSILMEKLEQPALLLDGNHKVVKSNAAFRDHFNVNDGKLTGMSLETVEKEMLHSNKLVEVLSEMETEEVRLSVASKTTKGEKPKSFDAIITPFIEGETHDASIFLVIISGL